MKRILSALLALALPAAALAGAGGGVLPMVIGLTMDMGFEPREAAAAHWHAQEGASFLPGGCLRWATMGAAKLIATGHRAHVHVCEDPDDPNRGHALTAWQTSDPQARLGSWWIMEPYLPHWALVYRANEANPCRDWELHGSPLPGMYAQGLDPMPIDGMLGMARPPGLSAALVPRTIPVRKGPLPPQRVRLRLGRLRDLDPYTGLDDRNQPSLVRYDDTGQRVPEWRAEQLALYQTLANEIEADYRRAVDQERARQAAYRARMEAAELRLAQRSKELERLP